jgi:hypothetical protein
MKYYDINFACEVALSRGGECLSRIYKSTKDKLLWRCSKGHEWSASLSNVLHRKSWCPTCFHAKAGYDKRNNNLVAAKALAESHGGKCLELENFPVQGYKVSWECHEGHIWEAIFHNVRFGAWCPQCGRERGAALFKQKAPRLGIEVAKEMAVARGGECLSVEYSTAKNPLLWRCHAGHTWETALANIRFSRTWCPRCRNKSEGYCHRVLSTLFPGCQFERNIRSLNWLGTGVKGNPLELDIYNEKLRLAVEFNGFLHERPVEAYGGEEHFNKIKEHDERKETACVKEGVYLISIYYSSVSKNGRYIDPKLTATAIWRAVADARYPAGTHLTSLEELLVALGL